jgi:hypothetical protein
MGRTKKVQDGLQYEEKEREETEVTAPEPEMPKVIEGTDGKVTMRKDGVGRRFHISRIKEMESLGWELIR